MDEIQAGAPRPCLSCYLVPDIIDYKLEFMTQKFKNFNEIQRDFRGRKILVW